VLDSGIQIKVDTKLPACDGVFYRMGGRHNLHMRAYPDIVADSQCAAAINETMTANEGVRSDRYLFVVKSKPHLTIEPSPIDQPWDRSSLPLIEFGHRREASKISIASRNFLEMEWAKSRMRRMPCTKKSKKCANSIEIELSEHIDVGCTRRYGHFTIGGIDDMIDGT